MGLFGDPVLRVTGQDIIYSNPAVPLLVSPEKRIWVNSGVPLDWFEKPGRWRNMRLRIPNEPHVFTVNKLFLRNAPPRIFSKGRPIEDVKVVFCHGRRDSQDVWRFANGQSVVETVTAYNRWAKENGETPVECVVSCNPPNTPPPEDIHVKDFPGEVAIVQAPDELVYINLRRSGVDRKGTIQMRLFLENAKWFGLDQLQLSRKIKLLSD